MGVCGRYSVPLTLWMAAACGCGSSTEAIELEFIGSTTVAPLVESLAMGYEATVGKITYTVVQPGSGAGIDAVGAISPGDPAAERTIGMTSRNLGADEVSLGLAVTRVALEAIAIVVHPSNPVESLSFEQLRGILNGSTTQWSAVGGGSGAIQVYIREMGSGTRDFVEKSILAGDPVLSAPTSANNSALRAEVAGDPNGIGYLAFSSVDGGVKALGIDEVQSGTTVTIVPSQDTARDESYPLTRPLLLLTKGAAVADAASFLSYATSLAGQQLVQDGGAFVPSGQL